MEIKNILQIKKDKGFTTADIVTSVIIIMIFIGTITTLFYNFYLSNTAKSRNAMATNCLIDVIEEIKSMKYEDINQDNINLLIQKFQTDKTIPNGYTVTVEVQKYNETEGNTDKKDLIKVLKTKVEYIVGQKTEKIEISTLLTK